MDSTQVIVLGILFLSIILWVSEVIPLFVTALLSSFLLIITADFTPKQIFTHYMDPIIILFFGGFLLAEAMQKHELNEVLVKKLLRVGSDNPYWFILTLMGITAFMSMWMSNTASAALMIPICLVVIHQNDLLDKSPNYAKAMILAVSYAATMGGIATIIGTAPNAIAGKYMGENGIEINFLDWFIKAFPFVIGCVLLSWAIMMVMNRPNVSKISFKTEINERLNRKQWIVLTIFLITVIGWLTGKLTGLSTSTVALFPVISLYALRLLNENDLSKISWGTLLLFGGGLALGYAVNQVKLDILIVSLMKGSLLSLPLFLKLMVIGFFGVLITMFASNTASAAVLIPLTIPLAAGLGLDLKNLIMFVAISTSLDFMIPVGTPPSAIAYSTGLVSVKEMVRNGILINLATGILLCIFFYFY